MLVTSGLDFGARSVKIAILSHGGTRSVVLAKALVRVQGNRDTRTDLVAIRESWGRLLADAGLSVGDIDCVASTGSRECQTVRVGHFYQRFSHALGASLLFPDATAALDIGVTQIRCALLNEPPDGRRYAASPLEGAVPGVTMARGDLATQATSLLRSLSIDGRVVLTGGTVLDADFVRSLWLRMLASESNVSLQISPEAIFAGAYGAAILAARRFRRISRISDPVADDPLAQRLLGIDRPLLN